MDVPGLFIEMLGGWGLAALRTGHCRDKENSYHLARMRYTIVLAPQAEEDLKQLRAHLRTIVKEAMEQHLRHEPARLSKSRIKRLRGLSHPQYRLRVGDLRVFYDITEDVVAVLAIIAKADAGAWLEKAGERDEESGTI
ncbi:MAG TPA: type II toxin-antitoxin system RelE/ParE family toxin [Tepidisphaeraceae bacterium]|nr:type II toxin-antitoxin system RelE/ParE family toxin [Tepidisphaeraceae bacterium]